MKRTRYSAEQIIGKLRDADAMLAAGRSLAQIVQTLGISEPTYHRWRKDMGGMDGEEAKRLKLLEAENARLKRLVAEQAIDISILKEANSYMGNCKPLAKEGHSEARVQHTGSVRAAYVRRSGAVAFIPAVSTKAC